MSATSLSVLLAPMVYNWSMGLVSLALTTVSYVITIYALPVSQVSSPMMQAYVFFNASSLARLAKTINLQFAFHAIVELFIPMLLTLAPWTLLAVIVRPVVTAD